MRVVAAANFKQTALLVEPFGGRKGHYDYYSGRVARSIANLGFQTILVTTDQFAGEVGQYCELIRQPGHRSAKVLRLLNSTAAASLQEELSFLYQALGVARKRHVDVVHFLSFRPLTLWLSLRLWGGNLQKDATIVATLHPGRLLEETRLRGLRWSFQKRILRDLAGGVLDYLTVSGPITRNHLLHALGSSMSISHRVRVVPYGTDPPAARIDTGQARHKLGIPYRGPILLVFGAFHVKRGYDTLFSAIGKIEEDLRILIAGAPAPSVPGGLSRADLEEMAITLGCGSQLIIHDWYIRDDLVADYFMASDIVVVLYRQSYDMSGPLMLACTYGRPVLATRLGDIGETVLERGIGIPVDPESPPDVGRAIQTMLQWSTTERESVRQKCMALANEWSWANVARMFADLYGAKVVHAR